MPNKIILPAYMYKCIEIYGNVSIPNNTGYTLGQIKNHLQYKYKCNVKINKWKYKKYDKKLRCDILIDSYIAEVVK